MRTQPDLDVTRERFVPATPERIWPLVDDPAAMGGWFAFADRMELVEGEGVGRRQRLYGRWGKKKSEIDQEIVAHDPPRTLAWRHLAERLDGKPAPAFAAETVFTITLAPDGDGTVVRLHSRQRPATWPRGLVMRLFGRREITASLERSLTELDQTVRRARPGAG
jgi:uncharacterized protein YndB with AHSA1/START domain